MPFPLLVKTTKILCLIFLFCYREVQSTKTPEATTATTDPPSNNNSNSSSNNNIMAAATVTDKMGSLKTTFTNRTTSTLPTLNITTEEAGADEVDIPAEAETRPEAAVGRRPNRPGVLLLGNRLRRTETTVSKGSSIIRRSSNNINNVTTTTSRTDLRSIETLGTTIDNHRRQVSLVIFDLLTVFSRNR
jgi:hypothetical protein